jgi:hypothetical protein
MNNLCAKSKSILAEEENQPFALRLGIGATVLSGGALGGPAVQALGATMGWAGLGIGLGDAIATTDAYFVNQAGTNTSLDPSKTLMPQDMKGHWGWVAAAWVGAGLDLGAAIHATRLLRLGMKVEDVVQLTSKANPGVSVGALRRAYMASAQGTSNQKVLREVLTSALPKEMRAQVGKDPNLLRVLSAEEFARQTGSRTGNAVTKLVRGPDGVIRPQVLVREGADPGALFEEAIHVQQLLDPKTAATLQPKLAQLTEANLAGWRNMPPQQQLRLYRLKIEVELDAQRRLIERYRNSPEALSKAEFQRKLLQARLAQTRAALKNNPNVRPDWLNPNQPPRLFNKDIPLITNKFPDEAIPPNGRVFGEVKIVNGRVTLPDFKGSVPRQVDFVITADGRLVLGNKHTALANRQGVLSAGQLKIDGSGRIRRIDNLSGHYRPTVNEGYMTPYLLREMGLDLKGARLILSEFEINPQGLIRSTRQAVNEVLE